MSIHSVLSTASAFPLLDIMPVPVLTFDATGQVTFANRIAIDHPGKLPDIVAASEEAKQLLSNINAGKVKLPHSMRFILDNGESMDGQFVAGPDEKMVSFMAIAEKKDDDEAEEIQRLSLKQIIPFLRAEVGPPLDTVTNQLRELINNEEGPTFLMAAKGLDKRLQRIYDLFNMYDEHGIQTDDKVSVRAIVNELITELGAKAAKRNVIIEIIDPKQSLPPVYVNKALFIRALFECMDNAVTHSFNEEKSKRPIMVRLRFTEMTDFLKIDIMNRVAPGTKRIDAVDAFVDVEGAETIKLGLGMAKRIIKLHGGEFHTSINDEDILDVTMQISLAPPGPGLGGVEDEQLLRYAADMATLMAKRAKS